MAQHGIAGPIVNDTTADTVVNLMRQIEVLRDALKGRTMSCSFCNQAAKDREHLVKQVEEWQSNCRNLMEELERARR